MQSELQTTFQLIPREPWEPYPGPRGFLSPWREYQATDKEAARVFSRLLYFLSLHHFALRLSPFHGSSLRKPLASRVWEPGNEPKSSWKFRLRSILHFIHLLEEWVASNNELYSAMISSHNQLCEIHLTSCTKPFLVALPGAMYSEVWTVTLLISIDCEWLITVDPAHGVMSSQWLPQVSWTAVTALSKIFCDVTVQHIVHYP